MRNAAAGAEKAVDINSHATSANLGEERAIWYTRYGLWMVIINRFLVMASQTYIEADRYMENILSILMADHGILKLVTHWD